jgi:hypothetical protein
MSFFDRTYVFFFGACTDQQTLAISQALASTKIPGRMTAQMTQRGHKVVVTDVGFHDFRDLEQVLKQNGVPPFEVKPRKGLIASKRLRRMGL